MIKLEFIYYIGVLGLVGGVIGIMISKFKEYEKIDFSKHKTIIIIYIILLIFAIILWRLVFDFIFGFADILYQDKENYESMLNVQI